jgi:peptidoglycan/xylan/chitin deacetylase (PgdA/CDA1 family)
MERGNDMGKAAASVPHADRLETGKWLRRVLACVLATGLHAAMPAAGAADAGTAFAWPHGARAAVSLAYDDALDSQLDHALPALDKFGLKGSFYLTLSNPALAQRMEGWRAAARAGHELGNHSLFHQCARSKPGRDWVEPHRDLDTISVAQMRDQVLLANTMLAAIDGRRERTFTLPCGDTQAGGRDYLPAVRASFVAIKVTGGSGVVDAMRTLDPLAVPVATPVGSSGAELIAIVKQAIRRGTMVNFTFHGIGGDYLSVSAQAHEELLRFLADNRQLVWTDTFINIMKHVRQQQARAPAAP